MERWIPFVKLASVLAIAWGERSRLRTDGGILCVHATIECGRCCNRGLAVGPFGRGSRVDAYRRQGRGGGRRSFRRFRRQTAGGAGCDQQSDQHRWVATSDGRARGGDCYHKSTLARRWRGAKRCHAKPSG